MRTILALSVSALAIITAGIWYAYQENTPSGVPRGERVLGIAVTEGGIGFEKAFLLAKKTGSEVVEVPFQWDEGEPYPEEYHDTWLALANEVYPPTHTKIALSINPIDTASERLPSDLRGKAYDDPAVIDRYKRMVDFVAKLVPQSDIYYISIGNEIDVRLGNSDEAWRAYTEFFASVAPYVRNKFPGVAVGSKVTYEGVLAYPSHVTRLTTLADVVLLTYYPFEKDSFIVRDPSTVHTDFEHMVQFFPDKAIYIAEIGYPSGSLNGSSESQQARFITESFLAWDHYATRIPFLNFVWLHDLPTDDVAPLQNYYGIADPGFTSYLTTLGLRTYVGDDKRAFDALRNAVKKRGW